MSVLAGVHGDELEGIPTVRMLLASLRSVRVIGQLRAVAVCNEPAFASRSRTSPLDGRNLARSFPGRADGDPTERIAQILVESVITGSSLLVDLHSAGGDFSMPWFAGWVATGDEHRSYRRGSGENLRGAACLGARRHRSRANLVGGEKSWVFRRYM